MTNAEKIAKHVKRHGSDSLLVHNLPNSSLWLVCQKTPRSYPHWKIIVCDPNKTTWRIVKSKVSDQNYSNLIKKLMIIKASKNLKETCQTLRKTAETFYKNNNLESYEYKLQNHRSSSKISSLRHPSFPLDHEPSR